MGQNKDGTKLTVSDKTTITIDGEPWLRTAKDSEYFEDSIKEVIRAYRIISKPKKLRDCKVWCSNFDMLCTVLKYATANGYMMGYIDSKHIAVVFHKNGSWQPLEKYEHFCNCDVEQITIAEFMGEV